MTPSMLSNSGRIGEARQIEREHRRIAGIKAAHSAGMKCLAVTNSYSPEKLSEADMIVKSLEEVKIEDIEKLF